MVKLAHLCLHFFVFAQVFGWFPPQKFLFFSLFFSFIRRNPFCCSNKHNRERGLDGSFALWICWWKKQSGNKLANPLQSWKCRTFSVEIRVYYIRDFYIAFFFFFNISNKLHQNVVKLFAETEKVGVKSFVSFACIFFNRKIFLVLFNIESDSVNFYYPFNFILNLIEY